MSSVEIIVKDYLEKNGYDGLVDYNGECGCDLKDFMPCEGIEIQGCRPGYKVPCTCAEECDWHIATKKPISIANA